MSTITVTSRASGRASYSVPPDPDDPVILQIDGHLIRVVEIGATGLIAASEHLKVGRRYPFSIDVPTANMPIAGYIDVLPDSDSPKLVCQFVDLSAEDVDTLHHYVLVRQKQAIRGLRDSTPT
ncbi:MAG: hypothetical protein KTR32_11240 [Granulosicoccus sp.]|nr:hypothetical protein [Granulosicoccus sp.]